MALGATFQIGRSALAAYQAAISIAGQNIANLGNADYARLSGRLSAEVGGPRTGGVQPGAGVRLAQLQRHVDEALEGRLRFASGERAAQRTVYGALTQIEALYNELSDTDVSSQLSQLFGAFGGMQTNPTGSAERDLVISGARTLISSLGRQRSGLLSQVEDLNSQATTAVTRINALVAQVADLNQLIVNQESSGRAIAAPLRDRRDAVLRELGELADVRSRERESGAVSVYINSEPLVEFDRARALVGETVQVDGLEVVSVRFADNNGPVQPTGGTLGGVITARDTHIRRQLGQLDQLARGLIYEVNSIHSTGVGLVGYTSSVGQNAVRDAGAALSSSAAGLPYPLQNGSFVVHMRDKASGQVSTRLIQVDLDGLNGDDTTLSGLAAALDGVPGLAGSVRADNKLVLSADPGQEFWFTEDSSGALAALGVNSFFTGTSAGDIGINSAVTSDPRLISTSLSGLPGDGDNAGRFAQLADSTAQSVLLNHASIGNFHSSLVTALAVEAANAATAADAADAVYNGLYAQRESLSGVNLDEEAINLTKFERAYQGAARYLTVLDDLSAEILNLI